jgi:hypothetical protein
MEASDFDDSYRLVNHELYEQTFLEFECNTSETLKEEF